jgi:hypothetical protein
MKIPNHDVARWLAIACLGLLSLQNQAAQFVEISAEIETFGYRLADTSSITSAKPKTIHVTCITGATEWYIENDFQHLEEWLFDGTNVLCRTQPPSGLERERILKSSSFKPITEPRTQSWRSADGHPLGHFGVNIPWLAFCSGNYLKREARIIPLPAAILRHCPDRYAYTDVTTTFDDELALPKSIDLLTSKSRWLKAHTDWDEEQGFGTRYTEWNKNTAPKIQDGVLVFHYAVLESTNLLGRSFPTKFEFFQTGRQYEQDGNWFCQGQGRVKTIRPATKPPALK